jgi:hypothetical protein
MRKNVRYKGAGVVMNARRNVTEKFGFLLWMAPWKRNSVCKRAVNVTQECAESYLDHEQRELLRFLVDQLANWNVYFAQLYSFLHVLVVMIHFYGQDGFGGRFNIKVPKAVPCHRRAVKSARCLNQVTDALQREHSSI